VLAKLHEDATLADPAVADQEQLQHCVAESLIHLLVLLRL
jgi:hypothetical protein